MTATSNRIFGLDLLRTLAIMSVVIGHGRPLLTAAQTGFPWIPTGDGVDLFFVLSGYLIGGILISEFVGPGKIGLRKLGNFLKRRWFRTLPNYYLVLGLNILFAYLGWSMGSLDFFSWKFFLFMQNLNWHFEGFFWESWSLCVEEWFYLTFPVIMSALLLFSKNTEKRKWLFMGAVAIFLMVPILLRILHFNPVMDGYRWDTGVRKVVTLRFDSIAYGLAMVCFARFAPTWWRRMRWPLFVAGFALFLLVDHFRQPVATEYAQIWVFSLGSIAYACWLPLLSQVKAAPEWLARPIRHISLISYSMYLLHLALVFEVIHKWALPTTYWGAWLMYGTYLLFVILISSLVYYTWERPMMNLRDKF